jgi:precorrin-4 C11-methyltransferase
MTWTPVPGTVYILGAGPGDPDLLTVRARCVLEVAETVLYADSLVDPRLLGVCRDDARARGTSGMTLEPIVAELVDAARRGQVVARVHSGDPGVYGAVAEQLARIEEAEVPWEVVPGVPSPMAAAAALGCELTVPGISQAVIFCRVSARTPMPLGHDLRALARPGVSLCVFLSAAYADELTSALRDAGIDDSTPAVIAERVSWPDEQLCATTVGELGEQLHALRVRRQALVLVGPAFDRRANRLRSALYDPEHAHVFRPASAATGDRETSPIAVYALTAAGAGVARRIAASIAGARVHLPARLAGPLEDTVAETAGARAVVARLMATHRALVLVMATGAAVRLCAPHLADKLRDPAVVAVDDLGRWAVPLAGAHAGGGNALARRVAGACGAVAVVTTASDSRAWPAPDELARERDWRVEDPRSLAHVTAALLDGDPVGYVQNVGSPLEDCAPWPASLRRYDDLTSLRAAAPRAAMVVSADPLAAEPGWAVLRPEVALLGVGCESGTTRAEIAAAVDQALAEVGISPLAVRVVATIDRKCGERGLTELCAARGWELRGFAAEELRAVAVPTPSAAVDAAVGTPSVCESAAVLAAGPPGVLRLPKRVHGRVTVAVAALEEAR